MRNIECLPNATEIQLKPSRSKGTKTVLVDSLKFR